MARFGTVPFTLVPVPVIETTPLPVIVVPASRLPVTESELLTRLSVAPVAMVTSCAVTSPLNAG